jgi:hypothetical protein
LKIANARNKVLQKTHGLNFKTNNTKKHKTSKDKTAFTHLMASKKIRTKSCRYDAKKCLRSYQNALGFAQVMRALVFFSASPVTLTNAQTCHVDPTAK